MGTDQNGDEPGKGMVSGGDTVLWKSGICAGKDTGVNSPAGRKGTFDGRYGCRKCFCVTFLLLTKVTKPPYPAKISYNRHNWRKYSFCAISGTDLRMGGERKWKGKER